MTERYTVTIDKTNGLVHDFVAEICPWCKDNDITVVQIFEPSKTISLTTSSVVDAVAFKLTFGGAQ